MQPGVRRPDPDFDPVAAPNSRLPREPARDRGTLVANPFLAILGWIAAYFLARTGLNTKNPTLSLIAVIVAATAFLLVQFHCLECGATGWAVRANRHFCSPAAQQSPPGAIRPWVPKLGIQIRIWIVVGLFAALYYVLSTFGR